MKKFFSVVSLGLLLSLAHVYAGGLTEEVTKNLPSLPDMPLKSIEQAKQEELQELKQEKERLEKEHDELSKKLAADADEVKNQIAAVKKELARRPNNEFLNKKQVLLNKKRDILADIQREREEVAKRITDHIALLEKYFKDGDQVDIRVEARLYTFEGLEEVNQKVNGQKIYLEQLKKRKDTVTKELKGVRQQVETIDQELKKIEQRQEALGKTASEAKGPAEFGLTVEQRGELIDLELSVELLNKQLVELKVEKKQRELASLESELFIDKKRLDSLEQTLKTIKPSITITAEQVEAAKQEAEKKQKEFLVKKTKYNEDLARVKKSREEKKEKAQQISKEYDVPLDTSIRDWTWEPKKTFDSYMGLCTLGALSAQIGRLDTQEDRIERSIALEQQQVDYYTELANIKEAYFKVTERKFESQDDMKREVAKFAEKKSEYTSEIKMLEARKDEVDAAALRLQSEVLDRLKKRRQDVKEQRDILFKGKNKDFGTCMSYLARAQEAVSGRIDLLNSISKSYTQESTVVTKIVQHIKFVLNELDTISIWYRPGYAISWLGVKNTPTDIELFFSDMRSYLMQFTRASFLARFMVPFASVDWLQFLLYLLAGIVFCFFLYRYFLPRSVTYLRKVADVHVGLRSTLLFLVMMFGFMLRYFIPLAFWLALFIAIKIYTIPDPYFYSIFYLVSIPYLLYFANRFLVYFETFNEEHEYVFLNREFKDRFMLICSTLLYATIIILFFRQAFIQASYPKSEVPDILLALNFIIFQISLIFLISKDQILSVIPTRTDLWRWTRNQVDRFYYLILLFVIAIIIMSNPYVGYGTLVFYLVTRLVFSLVLARALLWLHALLKRWASQIFFSYTPEDIARDRFAHSKTWFGLVIILSFLLIGIIGILLGGKIWDWSISLMDMQSWLTEPILGRGTNFSLSTVSLMQIVIFILIGFLVAFAFNRFVLQKIFDLMLVDSGLQHAITSISRYIVVAIALLLGMQNVGLGSIVTWGYAVLLFGVGYMVKDPASDLIAYFIILMQRPIKIGDYIRLDDNTMGVVRKITPKSVILRRKNSVTLIVPNTDVIRKSVYNWNYSRNFVAFEDIFVVVPFKYDPSLVRDLLTQAVVEHPSILKSPKPIIRLDSFQEYGYRFLMRGFVSSINTLEIWHIAGEIRIAIAKKLHENNITIAVPIRLIVHENGVSKVKHSLGEPAADE